ncbi:MAG TPA: hypothetical protein GXX50_10185 [Firmicutes bacterium]|uniref:PA2169 family four-helix-bundle protein n=1 Tax=Gelria sp. Kuro-4 TaxID=2796927 RepID=UPI0019C3BD56|nr:PA2169 family four-helix-bundle protein [Gelria sp. Kuro-4]BCV24046.1 hypothetical protein kuro4_08190 [Gelria sp. Kuro-4]HHV58110.1 hypothetical protein [Bacillota bacterium]
MARTSRELLTLQDHLSVENNMAQFMSACSELCSDPQLKTMCQNMARDHESHVQMLSQHLRTTLQ